MKRLRKIFRYLILSFLVLFVAALIVLKKNENRIANTALQKVSESIHAPMEIGNISITMLRNFPLVSIEFNNVWLGAPTSDSSTSQTDTLVKITKAYVSVKSTPLMKGIFDIQKIELVGIAADYIVDKKGNSNFSFLSDTTKKNTAEQDTGTTNLNLTLKELLLSDISCHYSDSLHAIESKLEIPTLKFSGQILGTDFIGAAKGEIKVSGCSFKNTPLHKMKETSALFDVQYNIDTVDINSLELNTDGVTINLLGNIVLGDTMDTDINILNSSFNLAQLQKFIPQPVIDSTGIKSIDGLLHLKGSIMGQVADSTLLPLLKMEIGLKQGNIEIDSLPVIENISLDAYVTNGKLRNNTSTSVELKNFHAQTGQNSVDIKASIWNLDHLNYTINSQLNLFPNEFMSFVPDSVLHDISGNIKLNLETKGTLPEKFDSTFIDYLMETSFIQIDLNKINVQPYTDFSADSISGRITYGKNNVHINNLEVQLPSLGTNIKKIDIRAILLGKVSNADSIGVNIPNFVIETGQSVIEGKAGIDKPVNPNYILNTNLFIDLNELENIIPDTTIKKAGGTVTASISSAGKLNYDSIADQIMDIIFHRSTASVAFEEVVFHLPDTLMRVDNLSGSVILKNSDIVVDQLKGYFSDIKFGINNTTINNLYPTILQNKKEQLDIYSEIDVGFVDYDKVLAFTTKEDKEDAAEHHNNPEPQETKQWTFNIKGKLKVNEVKYNKVFSNNISALFNLKDSVFIVDQFKLNVFDGSLNTSMRYHILDDGNKVMWVKNSIEKLDARKMLKDFDNFKEFYEPAISYENITGVLSSTSDCQVFWEGDSLNMDNLRAKGDFKLEQGGVFYYPPVQDIAKAVPTIGNMDEWEFKTINSSVFIFKNAIYIPKTLFVSNKLDAIGFGMHSFKDDYIYHIEAFLSDILLKKRDKLIEKQNKQGDEITEAGRKGRKIKYFSENGKSRPPLPELTDNDRDQTSRLIKTSSMQLKFRFFPERIDYITGLAP